jgi:hypothetical protein
MPPAPLEIMTAPKVAELSILTANDKLSAALLAPGTWNGRCVREMRYHSGRMAVPAGPVTVEVSEAGMMLIHVDGHLMFTLRPEQREQFDRHIVLDSMPGSAALPTLTPTPAPIPMPDAQPRCADCGHSTKKHCKGHEQHSQWRGAGSVICTSRHCNEPLCSCVAFTEMR